MLRWELGMRRLSVRSTCKAGRDGGGHFTIPRNSSTTCGSKCEPLSARMCSSTFPLPSPHDRGVGERASVHRPPRQKMRPPAGYLPFLDPVDSRSHPISHDENRECPARDKICDRLKHLVGMVGCIRIISHSSRSTYRFGAGSGLGYPSCRYRGAARRVAHGPVHAWGASSALPARRSFP